MRPAFSSRTKRRGVTALAPALRLFLLTASDMWHPYGDLTRNWSALDRDCAAKTGYQTLERYRAEGEKGLQDRSRAPHRRPLRCSKATELAVLSVRADHPTWGGRKIASHLQLIDAAATVPAPST